MNAAAESSASSRSSGAEGSSPGAEGQETVYVSERAAAVMRKQLEKRGTPQAAIRFGIRGGGCTGYSYMFQFEDGEPRKNDHVVDAFGVRVFVDPKSMLLIKGTRIDFETGMRGHGFRFENPNVQDSCGCGESIAF